MITAIDEANFKDFTTMGAKDAGDMMIAAGDFPDLSGQGRAPPIDEGMGRQRRGFIDPTNRRICTFFWQTLWSSSRLVKSNRILCGHFYKEVTARLRLVAVYQFA